MQEIILRLSLAEMRNPVPQAYVSWEKEWPLGASPHGQTKLVVYQLLSFRYVS